MWRVAIILAFSLLPLFVLGKDFTVCPTCSITSIKSAIKLASDGDRIIIKNGIYKEGNIIIDKEIELKGENFPVLDGEYNTEIITVEADNVKINGLQIQHVGTSFMKDRAGIKVETQKNCVIENNKLIDTFFGIYLAHSTKCIVRGNIIEGTAEQEYTSANAIHLWYCKEVIVENNVVSGHRDGIYLEFIERCKIINNISENNVRYGMHFMFSDHNEYIKNIFRSNSAGVAVMFSNYITMTENQFLDNWGAASYGILLKEIKDSYLSGNIFRANTVGLYAEGSNRIKIENNTFEQNGWALKIMGNCEDLHITKNNFLSNTFELSTNSRYNYNVIEKNYWSEYTGYDLDKDGIGDIPHSPVNLFSYIVEYNPPAIILLRSLFIDLLDLAEKITPVLTPSTIYDSKPLISKVQ